MKDNLDIEKLFKEKFENFEGPVNPQVWTNVSSAVGSGAKVVAAKTGLSLLTKVIIIGTAVVTGVVVFNLVSNNVADNPKPDKTIAENVSTVNQDDNHTAVISEEESPVQSVIVPEANVEEENNNNNSETVVKEQNTATDNNDDHRSEVNTVSDGITGNTEETESIHVDIDDANDNLTETEEFSSKPDQNKKETEHETVDDPSPTATSKLDYEQDKDNTLLVRFNSNADNYKSIEWHLGDGSVSYDENPEHLFNEYGEYTVTLLIENQNGSKRSEIQTINVIPVSSMNVGNFLTPNGDGQFDYFFIKSVNVERLSITIYGSDNKPVFVSNDVNFKWDGTDQAGNKLKKGPYFFTVIAVGKDGEVHKKASEVYIQ